jgi:hypothetical protein
MWHARWPVDYGSGEVWRPRCLLLAATAAVAIVWLTVLPRVGEQPVVREQIRRNERLGIDPAAKFYTELPCMPGIFHRVDRSMHRPPDRT